MSLIFREIGHFVAKGGLRSWRSKLKIKKWFGSRPMRLVTGENVCGDQMIHQAHMHWQFRAQSKAAGETLRYDTWIRLPS